MPVGLPREFFSRKIVGEKVASIPTGTTIGTSPVSAGPPTLPVSRLTFFSALVGCLFLAVASLRAAESQFTSTLSGQQLTAAGLTRLTTAERDRLNLLVAEEVARAQGLGEFEGSFIARRSTPERQRPGRHPRQIGRAEDSR